MGAGELLMCHIDFFGSPKLEQKSSKSKLDKLPIILAFHGKRKWAKIVLRHTKTWFLVLRFFFGWHPSKVVFFWGFPSKAIAKALKKRRYWYCTSIVEI